MAPTAQLAFFCILTLTAGVFAPPQGGKQKKPAEEPAVKPAEVVSPAAALRDDGRRAASMGDADRAARLFQQSLALEPGNAEALRELALLLQNDSSRADEFASILYEVAQAHSDDNGNIRMDARLKGIPLQNARYRNITVARAEFLKELLRTAQKAQVADSRQIALWIRDNALPLAGPGPDSYKKAAAILDSAVKKSEPKESVVVQSLISAIDAAIGARRAGEALRLARALRGLATQAGYRDLMTPAPDLKNARNVADRAVEKARDMIVASETTIPSIAELEALDRDSRTRFTELHADPATPGVTLSPENLYRIETTCGIDTLLSTAKQVEHHHRRIAAWIGRDPFDGRQGLVRIVPKAGDLDAEGSPFWWAGGFQSGDVTTLHFAHGTGSGLGRGLTHELTHRFDGAAYGGLPGWLAEGRAVWTGGAYGDIDDANFIDNYASTGAISETFRRGRGTVEYLTKLIEGTIEEYRDNYTAGHALWVYLWSWEPDGRVFRPRIETYMTGMQKNPKALAWFVQCFCDGKEGRPANFELFAKGFAEFIKGFWWETPAEFSKRYISSVPERRQPKLIYDQPAWHDDRPAAERYFGHDHAAAAGRLLAKLGPPQAALTALEWGLMRDEAQADLVQLLTSVQERQMRLDAAFATSARFEAARAPLLTTRATASRPASGPETRRSWPLSVLAASVGRGTEYARVLANAAEAESAAGHPLSAAALVAEHNRVVRGLGQGAPLPAQFTDPDSRPAQRRDPICEFPVALAATGCVEDRLTGFDEYRAAGLWCVSPGGDVLLGRKEFTIQTGIQREAWLAQTFTRSTRPLSGCYSVSARVRFLTSFGSGALVLGYQRHDRNFRINFSYGDYNYAIGKKENMEGGDRVWLSFNDLRDREPALPVPSGNGYTSATKANPTFLLEAHVAGPTVQVFANGRPLGIFTTATGLPVDGFVGFASSNGVLQFESPTYQMHHAGDNARCACRNWPDGVDLQQKGRADWNAITGLAASGFAPGPLGTAILWCPNIKGVNTIAPDPNVDIPAGIASHFIRLRKSRGLDVIPFVLALPETLTQDEFGRIREMVQPLLAPGDSIVQHRGHGGYDAWRAENTSPGSFLDPFLMFVDRDGFIRSHDSYKSEMDLPSRFEAWARVETGHY